MLRQIAVVTLALALLAPLAPAEAAPAERNLAFVLALAGLEAVPEGDVTVVENGVATTMPAAEAFAALVARFGDMDLAAMTAGASGDDGPTAVGDVVVLEIGRGACPSLPPSPLAVPGVAVHPQLTVYAGTTPHLETHGVGVLVANTMKFTAPVTHGVVAAGSIDATCFTFFDIYIMFLGVNGAVAVK